jgi:hypothetical protein
MNPLLHFTGMTLLSTVLSSQAAAAGVEVAFNFALTIAVLLGPVREYTAAGLLSAIDGSAIGETPSVAVPAINALILGSAALAVMLFNRQPLLGRAGQG